MTILFAVLIVVGLAALYAWLGATEPAQPWLDGPILRPEELED